MILLLLGILHLVGGALIADSQTDFGDVQGYNGWYYKNYDLVSVSEFPTYGNSWIGGTGSWQHIDSWCQISGTTMHTTTAGTGTCDTPNGHCAPVLTWINPQTPSDNRSLTLTAFHQVTVSADRDGVRLTLKVNGNLLDSFETPIDITNTYGPLQINTLELMLDPKLDCNNDGTTYRLQIYAPDPSASPSPSETHTSTITQTATATGTATHTPSATTTGLCNDIRNYLFGKQETVSGDGVVFTVLHGYNVTHFAPYEPCGYFSSCTDLGALCRCTYTGGTNTAGCPAQRTTTITYSYGTNNLVYNGQSPNCAYHMSRPFMIPSASPSVTTTASGTSSASFTKTASTTASVTPTASATGICNDIQNYVNGRLEIVYDNQTAYNLFHGQYITTPYLTNFDMLIGVFNGCMESGNSCLCSYNRGYNVECASGANRYAIVNFTYGAAFQTRFENQSGCSFTFHASYIRPSYSPSPTVTSSNTASWTASITTSGTSTQTASNTASWTASATPTPSNTGTETPTFTPTNTATATASETGSVTSTASSTTTQTSTASITASATITNTPSVTATFTPTVTPTGICNDVRNYVFGRRDNPTDEYTIHHGDRMTHYYYPGQYVLIGHTPSCIDYGDECVCMYNGGDPAFCPSNRQGIVRYSYNDVYRTFLVNDSDPVCLYQFNTTFFLPYLSPTPSRTSTATQSPSPFPTRIPPFARRGMRILDRPPNFPNIPRNASAAELRNLASGFLGSLTSNNDSSPIDALAVLASSLAAIDGNLSLSYQGEGFTWIMVSATSAAPIRSGNLTATLPALAADMVYSFVASDSNSSFPTFSVDALGTSNNKYTIADLTTPLTFSVAAVAPTGMRIECVYWNGTDWDTAGCAYVNGSCACTHFTEFSARFAAIADTNAGLFGMADEVYSGAGFKKYAAMYGLLIGIFLGIAAIFLVLLRIDKQGENKYRLAVEDIDEVCKVLGYEKPMAPQPTVHLPNVAVTRSLGYRICSAWASRLFYHHSYFGILFRYDPRLPRGFRLLLVVAVAFHTLFLTALLYGYTKVEATMTVGESVVLSLITALLNIPFIRFLLIAMNSVGAREYSTRFPDFAHEYNRRRAFEAALRHVSTSELVRVVERMNAGKSAYTAIQVSPAPSNSVRARGSIDTQNADTMGETTTDTLLVLLMDNLIRRCCAGRARQDGFLVALEIAKAADPHFETPTCNGLPTKTVRGFLFAVGIFVYIGWIMNYLLLFTASQSTQAMNSIASSFAISQSTSILITQPLTLFLTLVGTFLVMRCTRRSSVNHIGYFADPAFRKGSTSLSGSWAYWIFLYGGSAGSIGFNSENRSLGYSSNAVALAILSGDPTVIVSPRDMAINRLYAYLRGIQKPLTARAAAAAAAESALRNLLEAAPHSHIVATKDPTAEETGDVLDIVNEIAVVSKDGRS